jgi:hypothetical protein
MAGDSCDDVRLWGVEGYRREAARVLVVKSFAEIPAECPDGASTRASGWS